MTEIEFAKSFEAKWIRFEIIEEKPKTVVAAIYSKDDNSLLGEIKYYGPFRKYSFMPEPQTVFEQHCMLDIIRFMSGLTEILKNKK